LNGMLDSGRLDEGLLEVFALFGALSRVSWTVWRLHCAFCFVNVVATLLSSLIDERAPTLHPTDRPTASNASSHSGLQRNMQRDYWLFSWLFGGICIKEAHVVVSPLDPVDE
jgi:hypothetical protein